MDVALGWCMEKARQNATSVVEEELLLAALVEEPSRRRFARARLKQAFETGLVEAGERKWSRKDLYDR